MLPRTPPAVPLLLLALLSGGSSACANVAPYERGKLAHPTMRAGALDGAGAAHLRAVSEGAIGGTTGAGSGCGCN